jgi:uncharacterized membrane protein
VAKLVLFIVVAHGGVIEVLVSSRAELPYSISGYRGDHAVCCREGRHHEGGYPGRARMRTLAEFTKTTLIGGVLIILPIYVAVLLLAKAVKGLLELLSPVAGSLPAGVEFRQAAAVVVLIAVCFVVGLVVRTGPGLRAKNAFEQSVLEKLPGYTFFRGLAKRLTGQDEEHKLEPALVEIEDALVPALIIEVLEDGAYTVLVPSAPTPMAGSIYILPPDRVHPVAIPFTTAIGVFSKWGTGAGEFVRAMKMRPAIPAEIKAHPALPTESRTPQLQS